jgi:hypothetical protein
MRGGNRMEFTEARTRLRRNDDERKSGVYWRNLADSGSSVNGGRRGAEPTALAGGRGAGWGAGSVFCGEKTAGAVGGTERKETESAESEPEKEADGGYPRD